jgi:hypothetical protein
MAPTPRPPAQIGGDHYQAHSGPQPIELIEAMSLGFHDGNAIKYVARYKSTRNSDDLRKAIWYIERLMQLAPPGPDANDAGVEAMQMPDNQCDSACNEGHSYIMGRCGMTQQIRPIQVTVNECEDDANAARRFAGYIVRLQKELEAMGYIMPRDAPVDAAAIEAALMIARNCKHNHQVPDPF